MKYDILRKLNIILTENQTKKLEQFEHIFIQNNQNINLVSKKEEKFLFEKHIYDSLAVNLFLKDNKEIKNMLDIGTGGGFPSIPVSLLYPSINVAALDSIKKKINVVRNIILTLGLKNITAIAQRAEDLPGEYKNSFDFVTSRAMAELRIILEYAIPYVKTGGYFAAYKSVKAHEELDNAQNALKILNAKLVQEIEYNLPTEENQSRVLLIFKKLKPTENIYPRRNGNIKKNPL